MAGVLQSSFPASLHPQQRQIVVPSHTTAASRVSVLASQLIASHKLGGKAHVVDKSCTARQLRKVTAGAVAAPDRDLG